MCNSQGVRQREVARHFAGYTRRELGQNQSCSCLNLRVFVSRRGHNSESFQHSYLVANVLCGVIASHRIVGGVS